MNVSQAAPSLCLSALFMLHACGDDMAPLKGSRCRICTGSACRDENVLVLLRFLEGFEANHRRSFELWQAQLIPLTRKWLTGFLECGHFLLQTSPYFRSSSVSNHVAKCQNFLSVYANITKYPLMLKDICLTVPSTACTKEFTIIWCQ